MEIEPRLVLPDVYRPRPDPELVWGDEGPISLPLEPDEVKKEDKPTSTGQGPGWHVWQCVRDYYRDHPDVKKRGAF